MGNRANYIIISESGLEIFYTHWRATHIAQDMALGYQKLKHFIRQFEKREELINFPWIAGCILIDESKQSVIFWEGECLYESSVKKAYVEKLHDIWEGWRIEFADREMYDIESILGIKYIKNQDVDFERTTTEKLISDKIEDDYSSIVIIKEHGNTNVWFTGSIFDEELILLGEEIIPIFPKKTKIILRRKFKGKKHDLK